GLHVVRAFHAGERKRHHELAALADALAARLDAAAMQLHEAAHEGEPDAEAALRVHAAPRKLREHLEDTGEHRRRDADAVVAHADRRARAQALGADPDVAARARVLRGVVEEVREHLREPRKVGLEPDRLGRKLHAELVPAALDQRTARLERDAHRIAQLDALLAQLDLAAGDARNV